MIAVDPGSEVSIRGFSGPAIASRVCIPRPSANAGDSAWNGQVQSRGQYASFRYSVTLALEATQLAFDAFLKVV